MIGEVVNNKVYQNHYHAQKPSNKTTNLKRNEEFVHKQPNKHYKKQAEAAAALKHGDEVTKMVQVQLYAVLANHWESVTWWWGVEFWKKRQQVCTYAIKTISKLLCKTCAMYFTRHLSFWQLTNTGLFFASPTHKNMKYLVAAIILCFFFATVSCQEFAEDPYLDDFDPLAESTTDTETLENNDNEEEETLGGEPITCEGELKKLQQYRTIYPQLKKEYEALKAISDKEPLNVAKNAKATAKNMEMLKIEEAQNRAHENMLESGCPNIPTN